MAIPVPEAGRSGLVSFRLFGFPVTIHASFLVIVLLLGYSAPTGWQGAVTWLVVVTVSVIAHELGHAFAARPVGGEPRIDLYMMAGLTTWQPGGASRGRRVGVSVAGPFAGVLLGLALLAAYAAMSPIESPLIDDVLVDSIYVNLAWGLLNLLPMLPLDGGQVVLALMPGRDELVRIRRTSYASLGVAAAVAIGAILAGYALAAALVVFFAAGNLQRIVALRQGVGPAARTIIDAEAALQRGEPEQSLRILENDVPETYRVHAAVIRSAALLRLGRAREAQAALVDLPHGVLDPVFEGAVLLANGQEQLARERLQPALADEPAGWAVRELVLLLRARDEDILPMVGNVTGGGAAGVLDALWWTGDYAAAAAWGERALATGSTDPNVAYNTACAYVRAGDLDKAARALGYAAELGWDDVETADGDDDIAPLRGRAEWHAVRARMAANASAAGTAGLGASRAGG
ncbi:MAG TPA: hypothetical protein VNA20_09445 [Frankiaceae bacterium]|nr:hypothetical protein [Frankiaceae bacterium]